jgi:4-amino-4-deoxy-L-arabinose transferase-like glycosyltransferase
MTSGRVTSSTRAEGGGATERDADRFLWWLAAIVLVGLAIRLIVVALASRDLPFGDSIWYDAQSRIIADGHGYLAPGQFIFQSRSLATAEHPPLFPFLLAIVNWMGTESVLAHQVACTVMGAAGVAAVGLLGRAVGGPRLGLVAAGLAAVAPTLWQYDALVLSESLLVFSFALFLLTVYRFREAPSTWRAVAVGVTLALAAYTRTEMLLLAVIVIPLVVRAPGVDGWLARTKLLAVAGLTAVVLLAPWTIRNLTVFDRTVLFSNNMDSVIAGANCDATYHGDGLGSWSPGCNSGNLPQNDESVSFALIRHRGLEYARHHLDRLPVVVAARVGRAWEVYRPFQGIGTDGRSDGLWIASTLFFWISVVLGGVGAVMLRRAGRIVWPLVVVAPFVTVLAAASYGLPRLRVPLDIVLVVLAAAPIERAIAWFGRRRAPAGDDGRGSTADRQAGASTTGPGSVDAAVQARATASGSPLTTRYSVLRSRDTVPTRSPTGLWMPICAPTYRFES